MSASVPLLKQKAKSSPASRSGQIRPRTFGDTPTSGENLQPPPAKRGVQKSWEIKTLEPKRWWGNLYKWVERREPLCPGRLGRRRGVGDARPSRLRFLSSLTQSHQRTRRGVLGTVPVPQNLSLGRERQNQAILIYDRKAKY